MAVGDNNQQVLTDDVQEGLDSAISRAFEDSRNGATVQAMGRERRAMASALLAVMGGSLGVTYEC